MSVGLDIGRFSDSLFASSRCAVGGPFREGSIHRAARRTEVPRVVGGGTDSVCRL